MSIVAEVCTFDPETHVYKCGDTVLPSVSQIITSIWPRSDGAPADAIEGARLRGTFVDSMFMRWLGGQDIEIPAGTDQGWADSLGQAVDYWTAYRKGAKVRCQVQLFGEREAGTCDLIVEESEIIELKCTWEISKMVPAQLGGYSYLNFGPEFELGMENKYKVGVLHCHRRLKKAQFKTVDYLTAWSQWILCRSFYRLVNGQSN
jgi:hypothetical protein